MSRIFGSVILNVILLLLLVNMAIGFWTNYNAEMSKYSEYQKTSGTEKEQAAAEIAARCNVILDPIQTFGSCLAQGVQAYEEARSTNQDLKAQQEMAFWARWTFVIGAISLFVSGVGLYAVWQSLRQTRQAITTDREVGHAQVRAYIAIEMPVPDLEPDKPLHVEFKIRNTGQSPAYNVAYIGGFLVLPNPLPKSTGHLGGMAESQEIPRTPIAAQDFIVGEANGLEIINRKDFAQLLQAQDRRVYVFARVFYEDVFKQKHETSFCGFVNFEADVRDEKNARTGYKLTVGVDPHRTYSD